MWRWDQAEPFGNNSADEDPDGNTVAFDLPLRLPGQRYDQETGLHYNYFRDYDPSIGRYGESDPIGLRGGLNTYEYGYSRPLRFVDPDGLDGVGDWVGFFEGGGAGFALTAPSRFGISLGGTVGVESRLCCGPDNRVYSEAVFVARGGPALSGPTGARRVAPTATINVVRIGPLPRCAAVTKLDIGPTSLDLQVGVVTVSSDFKTAHVGVVPGGGASAVLNLVDFQWPWFYKLKPTDKKCCSDY